MRTPGAFKIVHVMTSDHGGASTAALRLHAALLRAGHDSQVLTGGYSAPNVGEVHALAAPSLATNLVQKAVRRSINQDFWRYATTRPQGLEMFADDRSAVDLRDQPLIRAADIVHLHWVASLIDHRSFLALAPQKPVVWSLHDLNPFTGGCFYTRGCERYREECGACVQLGSDDKRDLSHQIWKRKRDAYHDRDVNFVASSRWLTEKARQSSLLRHERVSTIPYGLDTSVFRRIDRRWSRELLGLPAEGTLILFGAVDIQNERKGAACLRDALDLLASSGSSSRGFELAVFGARAAYFADGSHRVHDLGIIRDDRLMAACYSAADLFVVPSLEEAFGFTCLEAMACELPVVAFDAGGPRDMVRPGATGLLARTADTIDLAQRIGWMLDHPDEARTMGIRGREVVEREFRVELMAARYADIYAELLPKRAT